MNPKMESVLTSLAGAVAPLLALAISWLADLREGLQIIALLVGIVGGVVAISAQMRLKAKAKPPDKEKDEHCEGTEE